MGSLALSELHEGLKQDAHAKMVGAGVDTGVESPEHVSALDLLDRSRVLDVLLGCADQTEFCWRPVLEQVHIQIRACYADMVRLNLSDCPHGRKATLTSEWRCAFRMMSP